MRLSILLLALIFNTAAVASDLVLEKGWIRAAPPMAKNLAGYGELRNNSLETITLKSMSSPYFKKVEAHKTTFVNGMMKMAHIEPVVLKPGEQLIFKPSGMHFMLMKPNKAIVENLKVPLTVITHKGDQFVFEFIVRK